MFAKPFLRDLPRHYVTAAGAVGLCGGYYFFLLSAMACAAV